MTTDVEVTFSHLRSIPTQVDVSNKFVELVEYYYKAFLNNLPWCKAEVLENIFWRGERI